jgi:hypothetical protein
MPDTIYVSIAIVVSLAFIMATLMSMMLLQYRELRTRKYDEEAHRAQLELLRNSFEKELYELNRRLLSTEERWRDINHLLISSQKAPAQLLESPQKVYLTQFLKSAGVSEADLEIDRNLVFVLTPFHKDYSSTFEEIYNVCRESGLKCLRGDEENVRGDILGHILCLLVKARIVVAIIDGRNPNVFYELGIAQAMDKGTILISRTLNEVPFDVKAKRIVLYSNQEDLRSKLRAELIKALVKE